MERGAGIGLALQTDGGASVGRVL